MFHRAISQSLRNTRIIAYNRAVVSFNTLRFKSNSVKPNLNDNSNKTESIDLESKHQSILTDNILEEAGIDMNKENSKDLLLIEEQKKRWAGTARKSDGLTSKQRKRENYAKWMYFLFFGATGLFSLYYARKWDDEQEETKHPTIENDWNILSMWGRLKARVGDTFLIYREPIFKVLLPDPPEEPYRHPLTLVLGLEDLLIHSEWTRESGWRVAKRPGVDYFLGYMSQYYEIVIFSSSYSMQCEKPFQKLDPYRTFVSHFLSREATRYENGKLVKDMSLMNRDISKIFMIDPDPGCYSAQPENAISIKPWDGKPDDELIRLIPFLEWLASQPIADVRPILESYKGTYIPDEFAKREAIARAKFEKQWYAKHNNDGKWAAQFLGIQPPQPKPLMPHDIRRREVQKHYQKFLKHIAEEVPKLQAEEKKFLEEQKALAPKNLSQFVSSIGQPIPLPQTHSQSK